MSHRLPVLVASFAVLALMASPAWCEEMSGPSDASLEALGLPLTLLAEPMYDLESKDWEIYALARGGAWFVGSFESVTVNGTRVIKHDALINGGGDFGFRYGPWVGYVTADYAASNDVMVGIGGVMLGAVTEMEDYSFLPAPMMIHVAAGGIGGRFEVDESDFGDFEEAFGFQARAMVGFTLWRNIKLWGWFDYRYIRFEYEDDVLAGDEYAVEQSTAVGGAVAFHF